MANFKPVRGEVMRATVTDECGVPSTGVDDSIVTAGFVTVSYSPELKARDEIELTNAAGDVCVTSTRKPQLKWYNIEAEFCEVNPTLFAMLTGQEVVDNYDGSDVIGMAIGAETADTGFSLEVWSQVDISDGACGATGVDHGYFLAPWLSEGVISDFTIENDAITFTVQARTYPGHQWGTGPYDVVESDAGGVAGPLNVALDPSRQLLFFRTGIQPPEVTAA